MSQKLPSLKSVVRKGVGVSALTSVVQVVLQIASVAVLSRLLEPAAFGIVAPPLALANILSLLTEFGMGSNIVQRKTRDPRELGSALCLVLVLGGGGTAAMFFLAPFLDGVLGDGNAAWTFVLAAPLMLLVPVATFFESLCLRDLDYSSLLRSNLAASVAQAMLPIVLALLGSGAIVLILAQLVAPIARIAVLSQKFALPRPKLDFPALSDMLHFSSYFTMTRFFSMVALNGDRIVLGSQVGATSLGYYVRAQNFAQILINLLGTSLEKVLFPLLASLSDERERMGAFYLDTIRVVGLVSGLVALAAVIFSDWLIYLLLGPDWGEAVPIARIFAAMIFLRAMDKSAAMLMRNHKMVRERAFLQFCFAIIAIGAALVFGAVDLRLVAVTIVGGAFLGAVYTTFVTSRFLDVPLGTAASPILYSCAAISGCAGLYLLFLHVLPLGPELVRFVSFALAGVIIVATVWLFRQRVLGPRLAGLLARTSSNP